VAENLLRASGMQPARQRRNAMASRRTSLWLAGALVVFGAFGASRAYGATVAVMPVAGVNLTPGECDAIGVLFANAFSRDANVAVLSPLETRPIREQMSTATAAAAQMGVAFYVELTAMQLGSTIKLAGTMFGKDGSVSYRAETVAPSLDAMETETARLARALIFHQPVPGDPAVALDATPTAEALPSAVATSRGYPKALGAKVAMLMPRSSGRTFSPMVAGQFDGRIGARGYFFEFGAGAAVPVNDNSASSDLRVGLLFAELGGSYYLTNGGVGIYAGGGVAPTLWISNSNNATSKESVTLALYGQLGVTFTRDSRARFFSEVRISQYCLGVTDSIADSSYGYGYGYNERTSDAYFPLTVAFQMGVGW
jgi:hypothetical protein